MSLIEHKKRKQINRDLLSFFMFNRPKTEPTRGQKKYLVYSLLILTR